MNLRDWPPMDKGDRPAIFGGHDCFDSYGKACLLLNIKTNEFGTPNDRHRYLVFSPFFRLFDNTLKRNRVCMQ